MEFLRSFLRRLFAGKTVAALRIAVLLNMKSCGKNVLYLGFNVFRTLVLIEDTIFKSSTGDGTAILRGHPSYAKGFFFTAKAVPSLLITLRP